MNKNCDSDLITFKSIIAANLKNFSLSLKKQAINCLSGPNGSGKTILSHHLVYKSSLQQILSLLGDLKIDLPGSTLDLQYQQATGMIPAVDILCLAETLSPKKTIGEFLGVDQILAGLALDSPQPRCVSTNCQLKSVQAKNVAKELLKKDPKQKIIISVAIKKSKNMETKISKLIKLGFNRFMINDQLIKVQEVADEVSLFLRMEKEKELYAVLSKVDCQERSEQELLQELNESLEIAYGIGEDLLVIFSARGQKIYCKNAFFCSTCQKTLAFSELRDLSSIKNENKKEFNLYLGKYNLTELSQMRIVELAKLSNNHLSKYLELLIEFGFGENNLFLHLATLNVAEKIELLCIYYQLTQFSDILFILDSPSRFLNYLEQKQLLLWAENMVTMGNTILFTERSPLILNGADNLINLAPLEDEKTNLDIEKISVNNFKKADSVLLLVHKLLQIQVRDLRESNEVLKGLQASFQALKKTKKLQSLVPNLLYLKLLNYYAEEELYDQKISGQTILEFSGLLNPIAQLFASLSAAKKEGLTEKDFLSVKGREKCIAVKWNNLNINDVFNLSVTAASELFQSRENIVSRFNQFILLGFSDLYLSRKFCELSYSEIQLLRVFREFSVSSNLKQTFFILEQVFSGLDPSSQKRCFDYLQTKLEETSGVCLVQM